MVKESIIYTNKWKGYNDLSNIGYQHFCVNHSIEFKIANTNNIEGTWSWLKSFITKIHITGKLIRFYLLICMAKRNHNNNLFD